MADKIVQLIDDQNNNIYPISRGLATNSVDTNAIQNGAVTSDKIDWTTLGFKTSGITAAATITMNTAYTPTPVSGLSLTLDGPVGAKYLVISTTTMKHPSGGYGDLYSRIHLDGVMVASISTNTIGADKWTPICVSAEVQLSSTPATVQVYIQGSALGDYSVGAYSRISAIRVA